MKKKARVKEKLPEIGEGDEYDLPSSEPPLYDASDLAQRKIVAWRIQCFEKLGFGPSASVAMGLRRDVDRQGVEDMVSRGAPLSLVVEIVL